MSRRNQARRRRTYTRRQHEVRERRGDVVSDIEWPTPSEDSDWGANDALDGHGASERAAFEELRR